MGKNIKEEDLFKKIGHDTINIYEISAKEHLKSIQKFKQFLKTHPESKSFNSISRINVDREIKKTKKTLLEIQKIKQKKKSSIFMSSKRIQRYIKQIEYMVEEIKEEKKEIHKIKVTEKDLKKIKKEILEFYSTLRKINPGEFEKIKQGLEQINPRIMKKLLVIMLKYYCIYIPLLLTSINLAIITHPHSIITRYPIKNKTPTKIYTTKLPIVKFLPKLIKIQEKVILRLEHLIK